MKTETGDQNKLLEDCAVNRMTELEEQTSRDLTDTQKKQNVLFSKITFKLCRD